ncbi:MAG: tRNA glutamyl-Q(34) synthetase GluQRS [Oscillospiraceae bacterium]|nr:tRNA glutamyl-Q(34) synthetase GluQRS [Oscillospiraceae bacterium]
MVAGRFAPSPSGRMHLGNVFSAMLAWLSAKSQGGEILLRIEDLDPSRSKTEYAEAIMDDFRWLGLLWDRRAENQSCRGQVYREALRLLEEKGLVYPCYCSRDQLHAASAPHASDGRLIYAGTCRSLTPEQRAEKAKQPALRLILPHREIRFTDGLQGDYAMVLDEDMGDIIVRRADDVAAYQLAVVLDDGTEGVTEVVRGRDLLSSTPVQLYIYELLGLKAPKFYHVPMLLAPDGRRLSKRDGDLDLGVLREKMKPEEILGMLANWAGILDHPESVSAKELASVFSWDKVSSKDITVHEKESPFLRGI